MKQLRDKLIADLTETRILTDHVSRTLMDRCELQSNEVREFLEQQGADLDEALVDTIFSPMYTPSWEDRARYTADRERLEITPLVISLMVQELVDQKLTATYQYEDDTISMPLAEVNIDRWVRRLRLDAKVDENILRAIEATVPTEDQDMVKALVGHNAWLAPGRSDILLAFLTGFAKTSRFSVEKFEYLTGLMQTYRPKDVGHFAQQIDALIRSYHEEKNEHFFDNHLKEVHEVTGGGAMPVQNSYAQDRGRQLFLATELQADLAEMFAPEAG